MFLKKTLIKIINKVKMENNQLNLNSAGFENSKHKFWTTIYFEYKDKNQIIQTWTRPKSKEKTTFAFVSYKSDKNFGNWINANEYFWWWKNSKAKNEFEKKILSKIKQKIENEKLKAEK